LQKDGLIKRMNKPINILQLRSSLGFFGAEKVIYELTKGLQDQNHPTAIGIIQNAHPNSLKFAQSLKHENIPFVVFKNKNPFSLKTLFLMAAFIREKKIKILHTHGYKATFYAFVLKKFIDVKLIATCHPWTETKYNKKAQFYTKLDKYLLRGFDAVVAVSSLIYNEIQQLPFKKRYLVCNGISSRKTQNNYSLRTELGLSAHTFLLGTVGRLVPEKGYDVFIEALSKVIIAHPNIHIVFVGDGEQKGQLLEMIVARKLESYITFLGFRDDIDSILQSLDIFVLPSLSEGVPMALLEALQAGVPCIATKVGDVPDMIIDKETGILVGPGMVKELSDAIQKLLQYKTERDKYAIMGPLRVKEKFSTNKMTEQYIEIYSQLVNV
jgi:glycosyltransferase involved in cell wall biosynthesis